MDEIETTANLRNDVAEILSARQANQDSARPEVIEKQHAKGKKTARERLDMLLDPGGRIEYGSLVTPDEDGLARVGAADVAKARDLPFEGPITCTGFIEGRPVAVVADDFTLLGGSTGALGGKKLRRMAGIALQRGIPLVALLDGGGHRIHRMDSRMFALGGEHGPFRELALMSGWAPHVSAVMGPAWAGPAMFTAFADFVPMVRGTGQMGMAGPKLVKAGTGQDLSAEELGGSEPQARAGAADLQCESDAECITRIKEFLSYLPSNASEPLPIRPSEDPPDRLCPELRDLVPLERRRAYDVKRVLSSILDEGRYLEMRPDYGKNIVTALGRVAGIPVGVLANQPMVMAGTLDSPACAKAARFVSLCDAYGLPLVSLIDTPGLLVGTKAEREGLVRIMGRLLLAWGQVSVPIVSIVLRKAYGGGYLCMSGGRSNDAEASFVWPTGEVCAMGVEGSVDIAFHREYENAPDPTARRQELIDEFYRGITPLRAVSGFGLDDAIDPAETRRLLATVLTTQRGRRLKITPPRRHWVDPG